MQHLHPLTHPNRRLVRQQHIGHHDGHPHDAPNSSPHHGHPLFPLHVLIAQLGRLPGRLYDAHILGLQLERLPVRKQRRVVVANGHVNLRLPEVTLGPGWVQADRSVRVLVGVEVLLLLEERKGPIAVQDRIGRTQLDGMAVVKDRFRKVARLDAPVALILELVRRQVQVGFAPFFLGGRRRRFGRFLAGVFLNPERNQLAPSKKVSTK